ncbi:hypothetical protein K439DRAFT_1632699 [Ramaria rubella]|nr:hypothetical protein K439DRAFT_1632699 [Ramaria rubella]
MSQTREKTNCALCRLPFPVATAVKLFIEYEETQQLHTPTLLESQKEAQRQLVALCKDVGEDAEEEKVLQTIVRAERLLIELYDTHGNTEVEVLLKSISTSLEGLRKRLKLFSRINTLQHELEALKQERDSLRKVIITQLREADEASRMQSSLNRKLKRSDSELEIFQERQRSKQRMNNTAIEDLKEKLQKELITSAKYQKKYYAALQELKAGKSREKVNDVYFDHTRPTETVTSEAEAVDDSLEIVLPSALRHLSESEAKHQLKHRIKASRSAAGETDKSQGKRRFIEQTGSGSRTSLRQRAESISP